jgi:hypothetical protein
VALGFAGIAVRLSELGTWGLSNDEAWVALATRVEGFPQIRLAIAMTPVAWAALVKLATLGFGHSEVVVRSIPFAFGCLGMWAAYRAGWRFAAHPLGGILALAAVAFDPLAVSYSKLLKQYTAEAFFCILAIDRAAAFAESRLRRDLVVLSLVLALGLGFANSQLFMAPPVFATLLLDAFVRRDRRSLRDLVLATAIVGTWDLLYYLWLVAPHLPSTSATVDAYWGAQVYLPTRPVEAAGILWERLGWALGPALGRYGYPIAMLSLGAAALWPRRGVAAVVLVLLVIELSGLSMMRQIAVSQPRILLFLTTTLAAFGAAAVATFVVRAMVHLVTATVAALVLAILIHGFVASHAWRALVHPTRIEDAGRLVQEVERERRPTDVVLLHQATLFIYAYYQQATPVLDAMSSLSVGYLPRLADPHVVLVNDPNLPERARAALRTSPRVWFLASRVRYGREKRIREFLSRLGTVVIDHRRPGAFLLLLTRGRRPGSPTPAPSSR